MRENSSCWDAGAYGTIQVHRSHGKRWGGMKIPHSITLFDDGTHREQVVALWRSVFGYEAAHNDPGLSIDRKMAVADGLFFVALVGGEVAGTIMAGYDGHRGW